MSGYIFSTTNRDGIKVVLNANTYNNHIITGHQELIGQVEAIKESIENPSFMLRSSKNENRILYVAEGAATTYPKFYVKTVVDHTNPRVGYVITSMVQKKFEPEKEGTVIYEKN